MIGYPVATPSVTAVAVAAAAVASAALAVATAAFSVDVAAAVVIDAACVVATPACVVAVAAAEVSDSEIKKLTQFGTDIGLAYQLKDDIIGVFGDQKQTGKSNESDIYEKKRTVLLQETHNRVHADDKAWLENQFMSDASLSKDDVQRIKHLIQESGARHSIEKEIRLLHAAASQQLANLKMQQPVKKELYDFLEKLMVRHV
jgi:geranylgeranyl pyrophosphate synthase